MIEIKELERRLSYLYGCEVDYLVGGLSGKTHLSYEEVVEMRCSHRTDKRTVGDLLSSGGCGYCRRMANNRRDGAPNAPNLKYDTPSFVKKAIEVHNGKYSYFRTEYSTVLKVTITCPKHGDFEQNGIHHLAGAGCPKCAVKGFNPGKPAFVYFLLDTETHSRVKIGVSNVPDKRLAILKRETPFTLERIELFETIPEITLQIESFCHSQLDSANLTDFDGATEWFKFDGAKLEALRTFILSTGGTSLNHA